MQLAGAGDQLLIFQHCVKSSKLTWLHSAQVLPNRLPPLQKQLIRMGPDHVRQIKAYLRKVQAAL